MTLELSFFGSKAVNEHHDSWQMAKANTNLFGVAISINVVNQKD